MNWADRSYWVETDTGLLNVAGDTDALKLVQGEGVKMTLARQFEPCKGCDMIDLCMDSHWNDHGRMGGPDKDYPLTMTHTCRTCGEKVFSRFGCPDTEKMLVPDGCPRWNPQFGSALDCGVCRKEREDLDAAHPDHQKRVQTLQELLLARLRGEGHSVSMDAFKPRFPTNTRAALRVQRDLGVLLADIEVRFPDLHAHLQHESYQPILSMWLERLYLSRKANRWDPSRIAHEFLLVFSDAPYCRNTWLGMSPPSRKMLERAWTVLLSQ